MSVHAKLALFGVVLHLVLFYSIFDIYYSSPLIQGTRPHPITSANGPATRLVIFSADGLRFDSFVNNANKSPFLHGLINDNKRRGAVKVGAIRGNYHGGLDGRAISQFLKASWGVSVSHVPTESRPGHVAILAGFYEDVSAVTRGWKKNPVPFDSIINRSHEAWAWGSPDIVSMFTDEVEHANADVYSAQMEDFFGSDASKLDEWVFTKVQEMFGSSVNSSLAERMRAQGVVFFLHLLGLDTNGHGNKPQSAAYTDNIEVVDKGIQAVSTLFTQYFQDNRTVFVFTSDHGMTDWGSHGAGTDEEVLTPFVIWGSGIRTSPLKKQINQVDLAPLMSALLGLPIPVNSVGSLPIELLDAPPKYRFQASYANLRQMLEQFIIKRNEKKSHTLSLFFSEFPGLRPEALVGIEKEIRRLVEMRRFEAAAQICVRLLEKVRSGTLYFHRYEHTLLGTAVASAFICWIWLVFLFSTRSAACILHEDLLFIPRPVGSILLVGILLLLLLIGMPPSNCVYILLPLYTFAIAYNISGLSFEKYAAAVQQSSLWLFELRAEPFRFAINALKKTLAIVSLGVLLFVLTSIFTQRWLLSNVALFMALLPHLDTNEAPSLKIWKRLWSASCVLLAIFPLLPTVGRTPVPLVCITAPLLFSVALIWLRRYIDIPCASLFTRTAQLHILTAFIILSANYISADEHSQGTVLNCFLQFQRALCWLSIPISFIGPLYAPPVLLPRLLIWFAFLHIPYSLLSLSYESLFLDVFFFFLFVYVRLEYGHLSDQQFLHIPIWTTASNAKHDVHRPRGGSFSWWEWSRGLLLVVLIEVAFFGTGNVASLNSFNPSFVRCFMQIFSPFLMTSLLLFKILIPFFGIALAFVAVLHSRALPLSRLAHVILIITDAMALVFFMQLVDDGSWLQIGMSISHYVIGMAISVFAFSLLHLAHHLLPLSIETLLHEDRKHLV